MVGQISPKLRKVIELWRRTDKDGERQAARGRGEAIAKASGMTFEDAVREEGRERNGANPFAGFDDHMEAKQPGWKAARAAERKTKEDARNARRAVLVERYGSIEAVLEPCERERLLVAAVAKWRVPCKTPYERWTHDVDGLSDGWQKPTPEIAAAIAGAYPIPTTIPDAKAERDYWEARERDMRDALPGNYGDNALDLAAQLRAEMVRDMLEKSIPARDLRDVAIRFGHYRMQETHDNEIEQALFRDIEMLAARATVAHGHPSNGHVAQRGATPEEAIKDALRSNPSKSDRSIARACGVSPSTVGKHRRSLGLAGVVRSIERGAQCFEARYG